MSEKILKLINYWTNVNINVSTDSGYFMFATESKDNIFINMMLDRSQANLLMLYLQEHLGNPVPKLEDSVMLASVEFELEAKSNVYACEIWNAAIEKAAEVVKHSGYLEQIRKLKV